MMCNEETVKSTFDKYLFHLVCLGEKVQNCIKQIDLLCNNFLAPLRI